MDKNMWNFKNCFQPGIGGRHSNFSLALLLLLVLTEKSQAQPFPEIVPTNFNIPTGTTPNTFGYIDQSTTITGMGTSTSTLSGHNVTSTGNGSNTTLFIYSPANETASGAVGSPTAYTVTVSGLTITNGVSQGGNSSYGGGGGGLGGGAFVGAGATLTLNNVNVTGNTAAGGNAGVSGGAGGGGIGGISTNTNGGGLFVNNANSGGGGFGGGGGYNGGGTGNTGGFGGGGGFGINGGNAGFGAGGGGRSSGGQGFGGVGGGIGSPFVNAYGGGGAGFGGGLFVQNNAAVVVTGNSTISSNTVNAGNGADGGQNGAAAGADIFMMNGSTVTLAPGTGNTVTIGVVGDTGSDIADDSANSVFNGGGAGAGLILGNGSTPGGTVVLYGNNTYAGGTTLQNGVTVVVGSSTALGSGTITMIDPTMVYANGDNVANPIVLMGDTTLEVDNTDAATQSGIISESGGSYVITKAGTGTLTLTAANTYSGGTLISAGTLNAANNGALGTGTVTVASGASLQVSGAGTIANNITISGTGAGGAGALFTTDTVSGAQVNGNITLAGDATIKNVPSLHVLFTTGAISLGTHELTLGGGNIQFTGPITGTGGLTVASGTAYVTGSTANTYTGLTTIAAGAVINMGKNTGLTAMAGDLNDAGSVEDYATGQLANTAVVTLSGTGQFNFRNQGTSETIAGLNGTSGTLITPSGNGGGNTLNIVGADNYTFAGQINDKSPASGASSTVAFAMNGTGRETLSGASNYSGGTTLTNGTLIAGNSSAFGTGLLQVNGGTLSMTNNTHTLNVGSYAQTAGTLFLSLNGTGQAATADLLHVTNSASLGGNLTINLAGFTAPAFGPATTYSFDVVTTGTGRTGMFGSLSTVDLGSGLTASLDYTADDVLLQIVHPATFFSLAGLSANQRAVLGSINGGLASGNGTPNLSALVLSLAPFANNPSAFGAALNELSPQEFGQFTSLTAFNNASFETEAMDSYLAGQRGANGMFLGGNGNIDTSGLTLNDPSYDPNLAEVHSRLLAWNPAPISHGLLSDSSGSVLGGADMKDTKSMSSPAYTDPWNFYVRGNVILAQGFSSQNVGHFDDNTESVVLGTDYRLTPNFLVGLTAGYGHTDVTLDNNGSSATVDSYSPGLYASYANKGWYADLTGDYVHNAYTQARNISFLGQTANSAPEGNEGVADLDGGYDFHLGGFTVGPSAGLQYVHLTVDGYNESGSIADLSVNDQDADSLRSRLGGRISFSFSHYGVNFTPHLDATWQHEFMDNSRGITSQFSGAGLGSFSVKTDNPSRDSALVDAGLDAEISHTVTVFADYTVQAGASNYFGQSVQAGVKIGF
jgi:autotransporter-associated beta strand protein